MSEILKQSGAMEGIFECCRVHQLVANSDLRVFDVCGMRLVFAGVRIHPLHPTSHINHDSHHIHSSARAGKKNQNNICDCILLQFSHFNGDHSVSFSL